MATSFISVVFFLSALGCVFQAALCSWGDEAFLSGLVGAPSEMTQEELSASSVRQAVQFAVQQLNLGSSSDVPYVLDKVVSAVAHHR